MTKNDFIIVMELALNKTDLNLFLFFDPPTTKGW